MHTGGSVAPWTSAKTLAPLIIGIALFFCFGFWEWRFAKYPIVPAALFVGNRVIAPCLLISIAVGMNIYAVLSFMPLMFSTVYNPDPEVVGIRSIGFALAQTLGASFGNIIMTVFKYHQRGVLLVGLVWMSMDANR